MLPVKVQLKIRFFIVFFFMSLIARAESFDYDLGDYLNERIALNLYVGGASDITQRAEFAAISFDITTDMSIIMGTSVADPRYFHYLDLSIHNPWSLWSLQSSVELGVGQYSDAETFKRRLSQSISFDYPLDTFFSLQLMLKRFTASLHQFKSVDHLIALGLGMRI